MYHKDLKMAKKIKKDYGISKITGLPKCKDCDNEKLNGWSSHCKGCGHPIVY